MTQSELNREGTQATGEDLATIAQLGWPDDNSLPTHKEMEMKKTQSENANGNRTQQRKRLASLLARLLVKRWLTNRADEASDS